MACTDLANVVGCGERENFFDHRAGFKGCRCAGECRRWGMRWRLRREKGMLSGRFVR